MLIYLFSIIIIIASLTYGFLFYLFPNHERGNVKGVSFHQLQQTPTISTSLMITTPSPSNIEPTSEITYIFQSAKQIPTQNLQHPMLTLIPSPSTNPTSEETVRSSSTQTLTLTPNPTIIVSPEVRITAVLTPVTVLTPTPIMNILPTFPMGLNADILFALVNNYRSNIGLPLLLKDSKVCTIARQRASQVYNEIVISHHIDAGLYAMNIPYWVTEDIIYDDTEQDAVNWWLNDTSHRLIIEGNYKYSCAACNGYSCAQIFTNFISK